MTFLNNFSVIANTLNGFYTLNHQDNIKTAVA
jgi:hypothetical protein